jgi:hypothetical protein
MIRNVTTAPPVHAIIKHLSKKGRPCGWARIRESFKAVEDAGEKCKLMGPPRFELVTE